MASSSSSLPSQSPRTRHDVFISFRGSDVRFGFLSHLTKELRENHIDVYVDERLERGAEISSALTEAIEESIISLVIFSKDYASSRWCLEELVKVMECKETKNQIVIPVFYNVDPSDVRHQKGSYADAFAKHEHKFMDDMDMLQIWRTTLNKTANLSGYHYSSYFQNESELIDGIVDNILKKLADKYTRKSRGSKLLVGIYQNFAKVGSLMRLEPQQVRFLGIWGTGGIGKTTLAQEIFDHFSSQFESSCFLENVRAKSKKIDGLKHLRQELLSQLLNQRSLNVNAAIGRLQRKKVLIVLDDVDNRMHLKDLAAIEETCLGWGSRVIITSRDKHVLRSSGIDEEYIHEMKELNFEESLKLFSLNAFKQNHPKIGYEELSKRTVSYAKGIPLALEVLGLHFSCRSNTYWESELRKLRKCPEQGIQETLKVSYRGLDYDDKQIFLDIAFFFEGEPKDKVTSVLEACDFEAVCGIENLVNKALVKISDERFIEMHDLIQEMAEQIVREESPKRPEKRSRLNDSKEIFDVLKKNTGTKKIQGITVDVAQIKEVRLKADTFKKMTNLRFIKFYSSYGCHMASHIKLPRDLESFPSNLRYFHWDAYPLESLPLGFCPENLVVLHMECNNMKKLWDGVQDLPNLETIDLGRSQQLMELPDFSMTRKLKTVYLDFCENLRSIHPSILSSTLVNLDVSYCSRLESLESEAHLKSLSDLRVDGCGSLEKFCLSLGKLERLDLWSSKRIEILHLPIIGNFSQLRELCLAGSRLRSLPINEFRCLTNLERFLLDGFHQVIHKAELEVLLASWRCLRNLSLNNCSRLSEIPDNIVTLTELKVLSLPGSGLVMLPACIQHLSNLREVYIGDCRMLRSINGVPPTLYKLAASHCTSLETIFCSSRFQQEEFLDDGCWLDLKNCAKFDEPSLLFIEKLLRCSVISAAKKVDSYTACYSGGRVPNWMTYKQASNTVEFACNHGKSLIGMVFCCVVPSIPIHRTICCNYSDDSNLRFKSQYSSRHYHYVKRHYPMGSYNIPDHVLIWYHNFKPKDARARYHGRISCEFSATDEDDNIELIDSESSIRACGVSPVYAPKSEFMSDRKRKRVAHIEDILYMKKDKRYREVQFL